MLFRCSGSSDNRCIHYVTTHALILFFSPAKCCNFRSRDRVLHLLSPSAFDSLFPYLSHTHYLSLSFSVFLSLSLTHSIFISFTQFVSKISNKIRSLLLHALLHNNNVKDSYTFRPRRLGS
eukprot:sb/3476066/